MSNDSCSNSIQTTELMTRPKDIITGFDIFGSTGPRITFIKSVSMVRDRRNWNVTRPHFSRSEDNLWQ